MMIIYQKMSLNVWKQHKSTLQYCRNIDIEVFGKKYIYLIANTDSNLQAANELQMMLTVLMTPIVLKEIMERHYQWC